MSQKTMKTEDQSKRQKTYTQFCTFVVANRLYGIEVTRVQEIVKPMEMTTVPLAPRFVRGLINLRGQVATAIGLRELFSIADNAPDYVMNVVCKIDGQLLSLQVDEIGDVVELEDTEFSATPHTIPEDTRRFLSGVYKTPARLLSIVSIDKLLTFLNLTKAA